MPVATAQLRASAQEERRSAATFGGVDPRSTFHMASRARCVTSPVRAPKPTVTAFQPYFLVNDIMIYYPDDPVRNIAPQIVNRVDSLDRPHRPVLVMACPAISWVSSSSMMRSRSATHVR